MQRYMGLRLKEVANFLRVTSRSKTGRVQRKVKVQDGKVLRFLVKESGAVDCSLTWYVGRQCHNIMVFMSHKGEVIFQGSGGGDTYPNRFIERHMWGAVMYAFCTAQFYLNKEQWKKPEKPINERPLVALKKQMVRNLRSAGFAVEGNR